MSDSWITIDLDALIEIWNLFSVWMCLAVGLVVTGGVYVLGSRVLRRFFERRRSERRWGNPQRVAVSGTFAEPPTGKVINRSQGGLGLVLDQPIPVDTVFSVRVVEAPQHIPWVRVIARHCGPEGRNWMIGCQFEERVPWTTLVWFG
jgi:hypothetical protein